MAAIKARSSAKKSESSMVATGRLKSSFKTKVRVTKVTNVHTPSAKLVKDSVGGSAQFEADLQTEVALARNVLSKDPKNRNAKKRLARVAIAAVNLLLAAEAVGNAHKVGRVDRFLKRELVDVGSRIQRMAGEGDSGAKQALGYFHSRGFLVPRNRDKACAEFKAAANSHAAAAWHWSQCQFDTQPVDAWIQIERAGGMGHAIAQEWLGRRCLGEFGAEVRDYACARDWLARSASQGRPKAQTLLAYLFNSGQGGPVDTARALRLYKLAAEQGDLDAQNNVGEAFETGRGVDKNLHEAIRWYERAAESGLAVAQFNAGRLWAVGVGERSDPARSRAWLVQAEAKGIVQARQVLDWIDSQVGRSADTDAKEAVPQESKSK
ncbi:MAG: sel1 repeat family protein [Rhodocyclales bacterium]|nr:sel1 repeat family protein [Rhodocyclales bacterium]